MKTEKKFYLIGIDSAPLWLIKELVEKYDLQGFKKIIQKGSLLELKSTLPPMTGAAWPTIYTGKNPSEHGVPDFFEMKKDYTPELAFYNPEKSEPFWKNIAENFGRCLIITPAMNTTIPNYNNIDMITGFPLKAKTNSPFLESLMKKEDFYGEPDIEKDMKAGKMSDEEAVKHFVKSIESRSRIAESAIKKNKYSFVYVCFTETDRLQHFVLNKANMYDYLLPIYKAIDDFILSCMERAEKENAPVMVVSDHGAQPIKEKFLINCWLVKNNIASIKKSILKTLSSDVETKTSISYSIREKAMKTGFRRVYDKLPHSAKKIVHKSMGAVFSSASSTNYTRLHLFDYDMSNTVAFAGISNINVATIFINDKRFEKGIVSSSEVKKIKTAVTSKLKTIKNSEGLPVIKKVIDADTYYTSKTSFISPDLFVEAEPGYSIDIFNFSNNSIFMLPEPPKRGDHTQMGIFGIYIPNTTPQIKKIEIYDIYNIILKYFNLDC